MGGWAIRNPEVGMYYRRSGDWADRGDLSGSWKGSIRAPTTSEPEPGSVQRDYGGAMPGEPHGGMQSACTTSRPSPGLLWIPEAFDFVAGGPATKVTAGEKPAPSPAPAVAPGAQGVVGWTRRHDVGAPYRSVGGSRSAAGWRTRRETARPGGGERRRRYCLSTCRLTPSKRWSSDDGACGSSSIQRTGR